MLHLPFLCPCAPAAGRQQAARPPQQQALCQPHKRAGARATAAAASTPFQVGVCSAVGVQHMVLEPHTTLPVRADEASQQVRVSPPISKRKGEQWAKGGDGVRPTGRVSAECRKGCVCVGCIMLSPSPQPTACCCCCCPLPPPPPPQMLPHTRMRPVSTALCVSAAPVWSSKPLRACCWSWTQTCCWHWHSGTGMYYMYLRVCVCVCKVCFKYAGVGDTARAPHMMHGLQIN